MKLLMICSALLISLSMNAQRAITGTWNTGKENTKVEIKPSDRDGVYIGTIVSSDNDQAKIGNQLLKDIKSTGGEWKGKLYSPQKDKWYNAVLKEENGELSIKVKAGMMSKTVAWKKE